MNQNNIPEILLQSRENRSYLLAYYYFAILIFKPYWRDKGLAFNLNILLSLKVPQQRHNIFCADLIDYHIYESGNIRSGFLSGCAL